MKRNVFIAILALMVAVVFSACAEKHELLSQEVTYEGGGKTFKGYLAYDKLKTGKRPGVLVVHEWWGQNKETRRRADMLAEMGYAALAVDMYGEGAQAGNSEEATELAKELSENAEVRKERFVAALEFLRQQDMVDASRIAAIGFSMGGNIVVQMALDGVDLNGVASFYGGFLLTMPEEERTVKSSILILHGEKDWYVTPQMIVQFKTDMKKVKADYRIVEYQEAEHGYSNKDSAMLAGKFKGMHLAYNEAADRKSWLDLQEFLKTVFHKL